MNITLTSDDASLLLGAIMGIVSISSSAQLARLVLGVSSGLFALLRVCLLKTALVGVAAWCFLYRQELNPIYIGIGVIGVLFIFVMLQLKKSIWR